MSVMSWGMGTEGQTGHYFVPGGTGSTFTVPKPYVKNVTISTCSFLRKNQKKQGTNSNIEGTERDTNRER